MVVRPARLAGRGITTQSGQLPKPDRLSMYSINLILHGGEIAYSPMPQAVFLIIFKRKLILPRFK